MTVRRCGNCTHPYYRHQDLKTCIIDGCSCPGFLPIRKGVASPMDRAVEMVRFAHHDHGFEDTDCTPANCSVAEFLDDHGLPYSGHVPQDEPQP
jgi:hypothetical protein